MSLEPSTSGSSMPPPPPVTSNPNSSSRRSSLHPFPPLSPSASADTHVPVRHPRPMTPAELHNELEKEQEAMVNRLTRELTALRAHSASVASTTSSVSTAPNLLLEPHDTASFMHPLPPTTGPTHPSGSRQHRSSSNASSTFHAHPARSSSTSVAGAAPAMPTTPRFEDIALHRQELEEVRKENERLKNRLIELERSLKAKKAENSGQSA